MRSLLDFDDAGANDDEPVKGVTAGDIRAWFDERQRYRDALIVCAAEWKSQPGSVIDCFNQSRAEFIRRMEIATEALRVLPASAVRKVK
jgi:hypothetical protein